MRLVPLSVLVSAVNLHAQIWSQLPDFPGTARDDAASFTIGNKVYVGTGMDANFQLTNDWYAFDTMTETWDTVAALPGVPRQYCSGFAANGQGYLFGGLSSSGPLNELWRYDPLADTWAQRASLPAAGRYASAVLEFSDRVCLATGMMEDGQATNETWSYIFSDDAWTSAAPAPGPARHRATATMGLLIGGADSSYNALSDVHEYWPWTDTWYPREAIPAARFSADAVQSILIGGASTLSELHNTCWMRGGSDDEWFTSAIPTFPGGLRRSGVTGEDLFIVDAGAIYYGTGSDNIQRYRDWWKLLYGVGIEATDDGAFVLAPIPADTELRIELNGTGRWSSWRAWSIDSRIVAEGTLTRASTKILTADLPSGTYLLRLTGIHGTATKRFTVAH